VLAPPAMLLPKFSIGSKNQNAFLSPTRHA